MTQLTIYDRAVLRAPNGWRWSTIRRAGYCASCDGELVVGEACVRRARLRVCESCARRRRRRERAQIAAGAIRRDWLRVVTFAAAP